MQWLVFFLALLGWLLESFCRFSLFDFAMLHRAELGMTAQQMAFEISISIAGMLVGYMAFAGLASLAGVKWALGGSFLGAAATAASAMTISNTGRFTLVYFLSALFAAGAMPPLIQAIREEFPVLFRPALIGLALATVSLGALLANLPGRISLTFHARAGIAWLGLPLCLVAVLLPILWPAKKSGGSGAGDAVASVMAVAALAAGSFFITPLAGNQFMWLQRSHLGGKWQMASVAISISSVCAFVLAGVLATVLTSAGLAPSKARAILLTAFGGLVPLAGFAGFMPEFAVVLACATAVGFQGCIALLYSGIADAFSARFVSLGVALGAMALNVCSFIFTSAAGLSLHRLEPYDDRTFFSVFLPILGAIAALGVIVFCLLAWFAPAPAKAAPEQWSQPPAANSAAV